MQVSILLSFHNYEQVNRIIHSQKVYGEIGDRYFNNFLFQKGKYALVNENLHEADNCFSGIKLKSASQKKIVMKYLIPCKMLLDFQYIPKN